ncbi:MAG: aldo/keto reductase [Rhodospirillales bacterium]|nr:aldo/keto reductase [Rhodospirillales bacterium]MDH3792506.1 aldo/keto reductase [Rhodospirillales bacterium]MDH3911109.1 aldo/keto reductase [Rhodospirillales bacterium]MDH3918174.1 aldo/keto reductase [Rhodospirillales bacterium]MDH3967345.1 aldo/keto reductase [Rhodospirillales bacterium]
MDYRTLGASGLKVSPICLGTMMFAGRTEEAEAARIVDLAREAGVNFIDTADVYSRGACEEMVGRLIKADREAWVLASKAGNAMGKGPNQGGLGRKWLMTAIDDSLRRLGTDYLDIYYLHKDDAETPLEETLSAIGDIIAAGKARFFGVSNYRGWRIAEIVQLASALGIAGPVVCQPYYNAMNRQPEVEVLPACGHHGIGVAPYSPLARGVLTGKYAPGAEPSDETRAGRQDERMMETEFRPESLEIARKVKERAEVRGMTPGQWALNWVLANPLVTAPIAGPRTVEQWSENLGALEHDWSAEDEAFLDALVPPGHPSTPGYSDPKYPITGRPVG